MCAPLEVEGVQLDVQLVAGLAVFPGHGDDADVLTRRAGIALAHARRMQAPLSIFSNELDTGCHRNISLMAELRKAIPNNELRLYCQPKMAIERRRACGLEALVRWNHPSRGLLNPNEFIHVAESTGLITSLTYWVLEDTLRQLYAWRESGIEQPVSVNMSAHDLRDARFLERVSDKLATWGARPGSVEFELTESALMEDPVKALEVLHGLKQMDVKLSIDDFGTGYSSLSYLRKLPVDTIKIDQSFVSGMVEDAGCAAIVRSTIDLAHNLKLQVIAEGVEDDATFDALEALGCDAAQGFGISRPMPAGEFEGWLNAQAH
jgi:EAL domain-containing protein (putative c-di-GMP-specific phosphodiesterase class I)